MAWQTLIVSSGTSNEEYIYIRNIRLMSLCVYTPEHTVIDTEMLYVMFVSEYLGRQNPLYQRAEIQSLIQGTLLEMFVQIHHASTSNCATMVQN
tara:strand:+ start:197 stop:478 length:282 start_codon:yes stop_codon:yes gene_type:complete